MTEAEMADIEWYMEYKDDDEIVAAAGKIKRERDASGHSRYQGWSWKGKLLWWSAFLCLACPWALVVGLLGILLIWFPPFGVPLLGLAGAPGGTMMAWRMDIRTSKS